MSRGVAHVLSEIIEMQRMQKGLTRGILLNHQYTKVLANLFASG